MKFKKYVIVALLGLFISCQRAPICVLKVGSQQLTLQQALPILEQNTALNRGDMSEESVKDYIKGLYARDFYYLEEAKTMGLLDADSMKNKILGQEKKILTRPQGPLYNLIVADIQKPSAEQLKELYDKRLTQYKLAHILLPSKELADSVYQLLGKGANFVKLVEKYSFDRRWGDEKGEWTDWFLYGSMGGDFDDKVISARPLRPVAPVHTSYGYQIVLVVKKKDRPEKPFNKVTNWLENVYLGMEKKRAFFKYQNSLSAKYGFEVNEQAAQIITAAYTEIDNLPKIESGQFTAEQLQMDLATFRGGKLSVSDFINYYTSQRLSSLPPLNRIDAVKTYAKTAALTDLMYLDALEKGLDKDEGFQLAARQFRTNTLRSEVIKRLYQPFEITEEEKVQRYQADSTFQIQTYDLAEKWLERAIRTEKMNNEDARQLAYLAEKYQLEFCDKGINRLTKALQAD